MKDLIISASTKYTKKELHNYVHSINECGFKGVIYFLDIYRKALTQYQLHYACKKLIDSGY